MSLPVLMVMVPYYAVGQWNSWFNAMIYLNDTSLYPLQLFLRKTLIAANSSLSTGSGVDSDSIDLNIKYATIIVSTVPILCVYPFLQKYFVKGVMIGSIKG